MGTLLIPIIIFFCLKAYLAADMKNDYFVESAHNDLQQYKEEINFKS